MPGLLQVLQRMNIPCVVRQAVCSQGEVIFLGPFLGNTGFSKLVCGQESGLRDPKLAAAKWVCPVLSAQVLRFSLRTGFQIQRHTRSFRSLW